MKKIFKTLKFSSIALFALVLFNACDKDFNIIESDVLGKDNASFDSSNESLQISAYNKKLEALQINNLASNFLGVFNDPIYGQTVASIITQVTPATFDPDFGTNPTIDEIILNIPYFNTITGTDESGNPVYTLDSLYGNSSAKIKLSIYHNNYFLRDFNPEPSIDNQNYYSNADSGMNSVLDGTNTINFDDQIVELIQEEEFLPSADAIITTTGTGEDAVDTRSEPALKLTLKNDDSNTNFWTRTILDKEGDAVLSNANNFRDYFRGLYFKAEAINGDGSMILLNFANANITIHYSKDSSVANERTQATYVLNFSGNRLNTFINDYNLVTLTDGDPNLGDEKLYLKGAEGSMAVVDLFGPYIDSNSNNIHDGLDALREEYRDDNGQGDPIKLINLAQLVVYEDNIMLSPPKDSNGNDYSTFDRIYAYDVKNNIPLIDYSLDQSENQADFFNSRIIHLGQRLDKDGDGIFKYKIRITEHLNNLIFNDSTNTKIGLTLSNNVNYTTNAEILNSGDIVTSIPASALLTARGTVLHGSNENVPDGKRMKLEIFSTEPNL